MTLKITQKIINQFTHLRICSLVVWKAKNYNDSKLYYSDCKR